MNDILKLQHISTKNALLGEIKRRYDYSEKVEVGQIIRALEVVLIDQTRSKEAEAELKKLQDELTMRTLENIKSSNVLDDKNAQLAVRDAPCTWTQQEEGMWDTSCENVFVFEDGTPQDNDCKYCPYCGHPLVHKLYEPEPDEDE